METRIEELNQTSNITYKTEFDCEVTLKDLYSSTTFDLVKDIIPRMKGGVNKIIHYRTKPNLFYRTIIKGFYFSIDVHTSFRSGSAGEGTDTFYKLLVKELGIDEEQAKIVYESKPENAVITIKIKS